MVARKSIDGAEAARIMYGQGDSGMQDIIKALTQPWQKEEIKWRVGSMTKDKKKALPLAYIDARTVMERLDNAVGVINWQDRYEFHEKRTICYLSIRLNNEWLCKSDGAGDSDIEGEKGGISDAFKRASVKWGMGRELYEMKCRWMPCNEYKQLVGNPWDFVIEGATEDEPEPKPEVKVITPEQRLEAANKKAQAIIVEYKACKDLGMLADVQTKYHSELKRFSEGYNDIFSQINEVGLQVIASFDQ